MKRYGDVVIAFGLLAFTMPLLAIIGLAIKCESPGPIFEREEDYGADGRRFERLRFRCTRITPINSCYSRHTITRTGQFLRCTRIVDLPQIVNVLRGEMTLMGCGLLH
jgi:lipopolysaccharide/colanic/teichoic acid biosynthesis glycosyltransferase